MRNRIRFLLTTASLAVLAPLALAHYDDKQPMQSYRQSYFAMLGMNFGGIVAMVKGESPWDDAKLKVLAGELATLARLDVTRAFPPGSDRGTTRAKPDIWEDPEDFAEDLQDLKTALAALKTAADGGDREQVAAAVGDTGKACKACHDEYKSDTYLY